MKLSKDKRLRKRREYLKVQRRGFRSFGRLMTAVAQNSRDNNLNSGKCGITTPKKIGKAHIRNKIKRRLRHILRDNQHIFANKNLILIAKPPITEASFSEIKADLFNACKKFRRNQP